MRTRKARRMLKRGLRIARLRGHQPRLIAHSGAVRIYGCAAECNAILECWDNPDHISGSMAHINCNGVEIGWVSRQILKLIML